MKKTILLLSLTLIISCKENNGESRFSIFDSAIITVDTIPSVLSSDEEFYDYRIIKGNNSILYVYKKYDDSNSRDEEYWIRLFIEFSSGQIPDNEFGFTSNIVKSYVTHSSFDREFNLYPRSGKMLLKKGEGNQVILNVTKELIATNNMFEIVLLEEGVYPVKKDFISDSK